MDYNKIIFLADIHFGVHKNKLSYLESQKDYFNNFFFPLLREKLKEDKKTVLFILGDIFESRESINLLVLHESREIFKQLSKIIDVYILLGNHDIYNVNDNNISSIDAFFGIDDNKKNHIYYKNIKVWKEPEEINIKDKTFFVLPWVNDKEKLRSLINENSSDYLLSHADYNDLKLNRYTKVDYGLDTKEIKKYKAVFSGHIHYRQSFGNINMIGCPQSTKFSDIGNSKGVYILDVDTGEIEFTVNSYSPKHIEKNIDEYFVDPTKFINEVKNNHLQLIIQQSTITNSPTKFEKCIKHISENTKEIKSIIENDIESEVETKDEQYKEIYSFNNILEKVIENSKLTDQHKLEAIAELKEIQDSLKIEIE